MAGTVRPRSRDARDAGDARDVASLTLCMQQGGEMPTPGIPPLEESVVRLAPALSALGLVLLTGSSLTAAPGNTVAKASPQRATLTVNRHLSTAEARTSLLAALPSLNRLDLVDPAVHELRSGRIAFRFPLRYQGVPVLGARATLVVDSEGRADASSGAPSQLPDSVAATVSLERAVTLASNRAGVRFGAEDVNLAIVSTVGGSRLAYVAYRGVVGGVPFAPLVKVDALTGEVLSAVNSVRFDRLARVHAENPTSTPDPIEVTLPLDEGATTLTNELVTAVNCIDNGTVDSIFGQVDAHHCDLAQLAIADDVDGDFLAHTYANDTDAEDTYAEVAMFFHLNKIYNVLLGLGLEPLPTQPLTGVVNLRMPAGYDTGDYGRMGDPELPLVPFDNAFYAAANPLFATIFGLQGAALWFGQGRFADFAYDGDVVYHEFGHAVNDATIGLVGEWHVDEQGAMPSPGSIGEGLADYWSSIVTDDGVVGEYAGGSFGGTAIRTIKNDDTCPSGIGGEVHFDSTFFSGAIWEVRQGLSADKKPLFDGAILEALQVAPSGDVGYGDLGQQFVDSVQATAALGSEVADVLSQELTDRGVLPRCDRTIDLAEGDTFKGVSFGGGRGVFVPGKQALSGSLAYAPGPLQFHTELPERAAKFTIEADFPAFSSGGGIGFGGGSPFSPGFLVHFGDAPLTFAGGVAQEAEAKDLGEAAIGLNETIDVPEGSTHAYFMIVNFGDTEGMMTNVRSSVEIAAIPPDEDEVVVEEPVTEAPAGTVYDGGCGCRVAGPSSNVPAGAGLLALLAAGLVPWARRRGRRRGL